MQRLAGELGVEIFPQHGAGRNLLDVGGKRRRYRGTIPRLGPASSGTSSSPAAASIAWRSSVWRRGALGSAERAAELDARNARRVV